MTIYQMLQEAQDEGYQVFQAKLVPNIPAETIIGVRTPEMRRIAKEVDASDYRDEFLASLPHAYYEENLIHFFILAMIRDFDSCVQAVDTFLPYVDCWPVSDQASPKTFKKYHEALLPHIHRWIGSSHVYTARFGMRMLMNEFLGEDFREAYLEEVAARGGDDYYLQMMEAWFFATALAKQYDATVPYLAEHRLSDQVHRMVIRKALESYRVSDAHKEFLRGCR